jgi:hypothetical protein
MGLFLLDFGGGSREKTAGFLFEGQSGQKRLPFDIEILLWGFVRGSETFVSHIGLNDRPFL